MKTYDDVYAKETFYWGTEPNSLCNTTIALLNPTGLEGRRIIDLGCGEGKDIIHFAKYGLLCTGVDISQPGLVKAERWAGSEGLSLELIQADLSTFRLSMKYDIVYSSGSLAYIRPDQRQAAFDNYKQHTNSGGIHAFNAFVEKPFVEVAPDWGEDEYFYRSGDLLRFYWDWEIISFSEVIFDCDSSGVPHRHAMDVMISRKP